MAFETGLLSLMLINCHNEKCGNKTHPSDLISLTEQASQVCSGLAVLTLFGLGHSHIDALQPLFRMLLVLSFQHVGFAVGEDLEGSGQPTVTPLLCNHLNALHFAKFNCAVVQFILLCVTRGKKHLQSKLMLYTLTIRKLCMDHSRVH